MTSRKTGYVFSYVNPDTDGVCSSIAYAFLARATGRDEYVPVVFGNLNKETKFVLRHFGVPAPTVITVVPLDSAIAIVDTHHKNQLPADTHFANVVEVIDHHPAGNIELFPNARIQNERVGAVATLIAERIKNVSAGPSVEIYGILAAAIISNTLNFGAPSTTDRDHGAFNWLHNYVNIGPEFIRGMFEARSNIGEMTTEEVLLSDYKEFVLGNVRVGISQLETLSLSNFLARGDLFTSIDGVRRSKALDHFIFNGVDIENHTSMIVVVEAKTQRVLEVALGAKFDDKCTSFERILLRKTDIVPQLRVFFERN